jgi:hypothetical protein
MAGIDAGPGTGPRHARLVHWLMGGDDGARPASHDASVVRSHPHCIRDTDAQASGEPMAAVRLWLPALHRVRHPFFRGMSSQAAAAAITPSDSHRPPPCQDRSLANRPLPSSKTQYAPRSWFSATPGLPLLALEALRRSVAHPCSRRRRIRIPREGDCRPPCTGSSSGGQNRSRRSPSPSWLNGRRVRARSYGEWGAAIS